MQDRAEVATVLLDAGVDTESRGNEGFTPLHLAALNGNSRVANVLLSHGAQINAPSKEAHTPLHVATYRQQVDVATLLLAKGASPDARSRFGETPLRAPALSNRVLRLPTLSPPFRCSAHNSCLPAQTKPPRLDQRRSASC